MGSIFFRGSDELSQQEEGANYLALLDGEDTKLLDGGGVLREALYLVVDYCFLLWRSRRNTWLLRGDDEEALRDEIVVEGRNIVSKTFMDFVVHLDQELSC